MSFFQVFLIGGQNGLDLSDQIERITRRDLVRQLSLDQKGKSEVISNFIYQVHIFLKMPGINKLADGKIAV